MYIRHFFDLGLFVILSVDAKTGIPIATLKKVDFSSQVGKVINGDLVTYPLTELRTPI